MKRHLYHWCDTSQIWYQHNKEVHHFWTLEKIKIKIELSTTNGHYIRYKVTVVLEKTTKIPVSILIHPGSPNDTKIFDEVLKKLKRRRLIKLKDIICFYKGYFSHKNYKIIINKYKIILVIFPKKTHSK